MLAPSDFWSWAEWQTNSALQCETAVDHAYVASLEDDVTFHPERWKNWDNYIAFHHARELGSVRGPEMRVLDAGACRDPKSPSSFLPSLSQAGFNNLYGCNLDEPATGHREGGITYNRNDITNTDYRAEFFHYVTCLSTIEHGVDVQAFLDEMYRIIAPGGALFVSFDYWYDPVETYGMQAFGVPVKIFDAHDVTEMTHYAVDLGFEHGPLRLGCRDRVVKWLGLEYTFMNLLFRKPALKITGC